MLPEHLGGYGEEERRAVQIAGARLRKLNAPRSAGLFRRVPVEAVFGEVMPAFNAAGEAIFQWSEEPRKGPVPPEIVELASQAATAFETFYRRVLHGARMQRDISAVFAENTYILARLLVAMEDLRGAATWYQRTVALETHPDSKRDAMSEFAELLADLGDGDQAASLIRQVLAEAPEHAAALALKARLNP